MSKKNALDQYYTKPEVVKHCWSVLDKLIGSNHQYVEPSAGNGVWGLGRENITMYDIEPKSGGIAKQDWLTYDGDLSGKVVVGNPPFGFASSLAVKFINHSFNLGAQYVAFILPRTFMKELFVDSNLTQSACLVHEEVLPLDSFLLEGQSYKVPCVFQVYKRGQRGGLVYNHYLTKGTIDDHDFVMRRVGGRAGKVITLDEFTESSSLFVKGDVNLLHSVADEVERVAKLTAGVKSITLNEINFIISNSLKYYE